MRKIHSNYTILPYNNIYPKIHKPVLICDGVRIIGDVEIQQNCSIWFNSVIRGDVNYIRIGEGTNIQDLSMLHVTNQKFPLIIGDNVTVAHSVTLHGCVVHNFVLVGIGACILDGAIVNSWSIIASGSVVKEGFVVPEGTLVAGVPAKVVRELNESEIERIKITNANYLLYAKEYIEKLGLNQL